jgi:glycosidase
MTQYQILEGNILHSDCHDKLSYTLFYPQARLARSEVSVPSVAGWQRWNCTTIRPWNSRFSNNTRKKTKSANNEREGSDQKPYSQTLTTHKNQMWRTLSLCRRLWRQDRTRQPWRRLPSEIMRNFLAFSQNYLRNIWWELFSYIWSC